MVRRLPLALAVLAWAVPARAADDSPERLLAPTTQLYVRWDGVAAHREAYRNSALGKVLAGDAGHALMVLVEQIPTSLSSSLVGDPLLQGTPPDELQRIHADLKNATRLPQLLADRGIVIGAELRESSPFALDSLLPRVRGLITGDAAAMEFILPEVQLTVIVPDGAADVEVIAAAVRLLARGGDLKIKEQKVLGTSVGSIQGEEGNPVRLGWWVEGKHLVFSAGTLPPERVLRRMRSSREGITANPNFQRLAAFKDFRPVTRGYLDGASLLNAVKRITQPFAPTAWPRVEALGLANLKSIRFWSGFEGEESRAVVEIELPGPRQGLAKLFVPKPFKASELPPMPSNVAQWTAGRLDLRGLYEFFLALAAEEPPGPQAAAEERADGEDKAAPVDPAEAFRKAKEKAARDFDEALGMKFTDLLDALGDKVVTYQSPTEGVISMGQVLAISVKNEPALRSALDQFVRGSENIFGPLRVRKKNYHGVEVREHYARRSIIVPTYAICDGWLVIGLMPQPVQGFVLRSKGKIAAWKPDAHTAAAMAKASPDSSLLQMADPRVTFQQLLNVAPFLTQAISAFEGDDAPGKIDVGLIPNALAVSDPLFPNVVSLRDDGTTIRWEARDSIGLPIEVSGLEVFGLALLGQLAF